MGSRYSQLANRPARLTPRAASAREPEGVVPAPASHSVARASRLEPGGRGGGWEGGWRGGEGWRREGWRRGVRGGGLEGRVGEGRVGEGRVGGEGWRRGVGGEGWRRGVGEGGLGEGCKHQPTPNQTERSTGRGGLEKGGQRGWRGAGVAWRVCVCVTV